MGMLVLSVEYGQVVQVGETLVQIISNNGSKGLKVGFQTLRTKETITRKLARMTPEACHEALRLIDEWKKRRPGIDE